MAITFIALRNCSASNSAGVHISPRMTSSKWPLSSPFNSCIKSCNKICEISKVKGQSLDLLCTDGANQTLQIVNAYSFQLKKLMVSTSEECCTFPYIVLNIIFVFCLCSLLHRVSTSIIAFSSVPKCIFNIAHAYSK